VVGGRRAVRDDRTEGREGTNPSVTWFVDLGKPVKRAWPAFLRLAEGSDSLGNNPTVEETVDQGIRSLKDRLHRERGGTVVRSMQEKMAGPDVVSSVHNHDGAALVRWFDNNVRTFGQAA
jgi:hypothetical protein